MYYTPEQFKTIIDFLVHTTLKREFSAYIPQFKRAIEVRVEYIDHLDGFNVHFHNKEEIMIEAFTVVNGSGMDFEPHVREAIVRVLGLHII